MLAASIGERNRSAVRVGDWICSSGLSERWLQRLGGRPVLDVPSLCERVLGRGFEFGGEGVLIGLATGYDAGEAHTAIVEGSRR